MHDSPDPLSELVEETRRSLADSKKAEYDKLIKRIVERYLLGQARKSQSKVLSDSSYYDSYLTTYRELMDPNSPTQRLTRIINWLRARQQREINKILKDI